MKTKEAITELIYKNSTDTGSGILIDFKEIQLLIDKLDALFSLNNVSITLNERLITPEKLILDNDGKWIKIEQRELLEGFVDWFNTNDKTQAILSERIEEYLKTL